MLLNIRLKLMCFLLIATKSCVCGPIEVATAHIRSNYIIPGESNVDIAASLGLSTQLRETRNNHGIFPLISDVTNSMRMRASKILSLTRKNAAQKVKMCRTLVNRFRNTSSADDLVNEWHIEEDIKRAHEYVSHESGLWEYVCETDGIKVWKANQPLCVNEEDKRWQCLMAKTTIDISLDDLKNLLLDSSKAKLLNRYLVFKRCMNKTTTLDLILLFHPLFYLQDIHLEGRTRLFLTSILRLFEIAPKCLSLRSHWISVHSCMNILSLAVVSL